MNKTIIIQDSVVLVVDNDIFNTNLEKIVDNKWYDSYVGFDDLEDLKDYLEHILPVLLGDKK